jgi:hypothetical protein
MGGPETSAFVIKAAVPDLAAQSFAFAAQKTMYGGKGIAAGDRIFLFASETAGGHGLFARGIVTSVAPVARVPDVARQTPRVSVTIDHVEAAAAPLGRDELKRFRDWQDGQPQTELNFKLYRQATDKIVGIGPATAAFLDRVFAAPHGSD